VFSEEIGITYLLTKPHIVSKNSFFSFSVDRGLIADSYHLKVMSDVSDAFFAGNGFGALVMVLFGKGFLQRKGHSQDDLSLNHCPVR